MSGNTEKSLTPAKVRAVLRKAGFSPAKSAKTRVRGFHSWSPGYRVAGDGVEAHIEYRDDDSKAAQHWVWLERYRTALTAAGLVVRDGPFVALVVTAPQKD